MPMFTIEDTPENLALALAQAAEEGFAVEYSFGGDSAQAEPAPLGEDGMGSTNYDLPASTRRFVYTITFGEGVS